MEMYLFMKEQNIYTIRYLFEKGTIITKVQKETDGDAKITISTHKNNPFIKFCTEYRDTHQGEKKISIGEIAEQWKQLDDATKQKNTDIKKEKNESITQENTKNAAEKRKNTSNDDDEVTKKQKKMTAIIKKIINAC